ncbi:MAG: hypothetical protein JO219_02025 [Candidatus Eremiobacteraeota bacterium]|nr:hypothetical protein [Candidatus Eremiobacteraeota bacterium]MBV8366612.1 hypothetical protein [Candidatus Eremiobacteraeota bacterium]
MPVSGPRIASASFYASFLFDVADTIDLTKLGSIAGEDTAPAPLRFRAASTPENIQFAVPPVAANLPTIAFDGVSASARAKIYDYGVVSIRFAVPYSGDWSGFIDLVIGLRAGDRLLHHARTILDGILRDCASALVEPHPTLVEDYFTAAIEELDVPLDAAALLANYGAAIVGLISAEHQPLSPEEQTETLRLRFSYLPDDLVVVQWDSAFIYDSREHAQVIVDLLEFANSQLVEFRTYDARLDQELDAIYPAEVAPRPRWSALHRRQAEERAQELRYLLVDIRELADRASNALKIVGDAYYARVYRAIAQRLGLDVWQRQIESKLDAVGDVYRYFTDQAQTARSEFLELIVILLIAIEIVVGILGLRH